MANQQDNRPKFEEMSGFQEIEIEVADENFIEKVESYTIEILEMMSALAKTFFLPLVVRFAIIYLILNLMFYGEDAVYYITRIIFLVVLLVYEGR